MRRKEETSILGIFQDPLLILIALILLGTLWIVVPAEQPASPQESDRFELQKEIDQLKKEIMSMDDRVKKFTEDIDRLADEINILENQEKEVQKKEAEEKSEIHRLNQEIAALKALLRTKKENLEKLEKDLERLKEQAKEAEQVKEIEQKIRELKKEIIEKEALLKKMEEDLGKAKERESKYIVKKKGLEETIVKLQQQVEAEKEAVKKLKKEKKKLDTLLKERGGLGKYTAEAVKGKYMVSFEAVKNTLIFMDEKNYKYETYRDISSGGIEMVAKLTRKRSAKSESIDQIKKVDSEFQKELNKVKPETHFIGFAVRKDSFKIFLAARQIVLKKGFAVSWLPIEGPIYIGPGESEGKK